MNYTFKTDLLTKQNSGQVFQIVKFAIIEKWCRTTKSFRQQKVFYHFQSVLLIHERFYS